MSRPSLPRRTVAWLALSSYCINSVHSLPWPWGLGDAVVKKNADADTVEVSPEYEGLGLLQDVDIEDDRYYSLSLAMDNIEDFDWFTKRGIAWEAASVDAKALGISTDEYLESMKARMAEYAASDDLQGHFHLRIFLLDLIPGDIVLIMGNPSIGKSRVVRHFKELLESLCYRRPDGEYVKSIRKGYSIRNGYLPLYVDGNALKPGSDLKDGIFKAYIDELSTSNSRWLLLTRLRALRKSLAECVPDMIDSISKCRGLGQFSCARIRRAIEDSWCSNQISAIDSFSRMANILRKQPVLIVDGIEKMIDEGSGEFSRSLVNAILSHAKSKKMTVILVSSTYTCQQQLESAGAHPDCISSKYIAGELPPYAMWHILVKYVKEGGRRKAIGMGPNLASILMSAYGGQYSTIQRSLTHLANTKENFTLQSAMIDSIEMVDACLSSISTVLDDDATIVLQLLQILAFRGFFPVISGTTKYAKTIDDFSLGGIVDSGSIVKEVFPPQVFSMYDCNYVLVPRSNAHRLVVAHAMLGRGVVRTNSTSDSRPNMELPHISSWRFSFEDSDTDLEDDDH